MSTLMKGWKPSWYENEHDSAWARVREALKRDWEQTKHDLGMGGEELHQNVGDTIGQVAGKAPIPNGANPTPGSSWNDVEEPIGYGYAAQSQYAKDHPTWNSAEGKLRNEWESAKHATERGWEDVKDHVRRGYEYRR